MTRAETTERSADLVEAVLTYTIDTGEKPVSDPVGPTGRLRYRTGTYEQRTVAIRNGRPLRKRFSLDRQGFVLAGHETAVADFHDEGELRSLLYPEVEQMVKALSGASRVVIFDHTLRSGDEAAQERRRLREPSRVVHNDYTEWSAPRRVRDLLPDESEALLRHRFAVIQMWRPIRTPIERDPLAICDSRSLAPEDLIAAERRHPDRVGEIYQIAFNPDHRWFYFPNMQRDEALVFKCYDSEKDGRARFTAHASFDDPTSPPEAPPRESIEVRTLAFFAPAH